MGIVLLPLTIFIFLLSATYKSLLFLVKAIYTRLVECVRKRLSQYRLQKAQRRKERALTDITYRRDLALSDAQNAKKELRLLKQKEQQLELFLERNREQQAGANARIPTPTYRIAAPDAQNGEDDLPEEVTKKLRKANS